MTCNLAFQFIANACGIFIGKEGTRILCDPWLVDGVFEGSWCHFEKLKTTVSDVQDVDAIYVSHLHPDHFDERHFEFDKAKPIIVLDHGPNFLIKKLTAMGFYNLIKIKNGETISYKEFNITMFAPFAKHNFHEALIGNLIDSAMVIECNGVIALNANDNTPSVEAGKMLRERFGTLDLAMLNYNAAGPFPSCFDNLTIAEKKSAQERVLERNFNHVKNVLRALKPKYMLPFAGAYVLGGDLYYKNEYLGTTTWDKCADWLRKEDIGGTKIITLRETDIFYIDTATTNRAYVPVDVEKMSAYIKTELSAMRYPYQLEEYPDEATLKENIKKAAAALKDRLARYGIRSDFNVIIKAYNKKYSIYPEYREAGVEAITGNTLECSLDERLLRNILERKTYWNNAEGGAHINFIRTPDKYEPDLHTGLQFFHI